MAVAPPPASALKELPLVKGRHFLHNGLQIREDFPGFIERNQQEYGNVFKVSLLTNRMIITMEPDMVRYVLQENNKNYHKSIGYEVLSLVLGKGLLTSEGDFWRKQRRLAQPAFHKRKLQALAASMTDEASILADQWEQKFQPGKPFDIYPEMMAVTMKIVARTLFSAKVDEVIDVVSKDVGMLNEFAIQRIMQLIRLPVWLPLRKHKLYHKASKELDAVLYGIIDERRKNGHPQEDLLSMLMEVKDEDTGEVMSNRQLRDEAMTLFIAGHETTAVGMTWAWKLLGDHPEVADKLYAELDAVLGNRDVSPEDLPHLVYTRQVVDEVLRLYPPVWIFGRITLANDVICGYQASKGTNILMVPYHIHRRPDLWEAPEVFRPERFSPELNKQRPRYAYLPFGGGPRLCIGNNFALMEMTVLLATLANRFRLRAADSNPVPFEALITLRPGAPVMMQRTR